ncbi:MAG: PspC domain-containing protein [Candidatus Cloacimonadales bacterium]|jgi:phage shock protein PspC (stress-responsive transcriptional regulator)|nr:PspC domain-containing protein [Candidatus Cloacimonadota bacterium]MDX9976537.1 PspC domain-containing protein [Candidatus Cloacimonadales bacterium]
MELHRSAHNKMIAGVCAGLAESLRIDSSVIRIVFLLSTLSGFAGFFIYLVLWVILPVREFNITYTSSFYRPNNGRMIGGVCRAISNATKIDVSIIRIAFILVAIFFGSGIVIYLILWIATPTENIIEER